MYIYDVRRGKGEGVTKKQTRVLISCVSVTVTRAPLVTVTVTVGEGIKKLEILRTSFAPYVESTSF